MATTLTNEETNKLKRIIDQGIKTTQEITDLRESLKDTVKAVAEELDMKPALINKAIRVAYKVSLEDEKDAVNEVEEVLAAVGRA